MEKRALKILLDAHWLPKGWKSGDDRRTTLEDFEFAKQNGMMFDPVEMDHALAIELLLKSIAKLNRRIVADAFLASLSSRRLDWRSALGSYAVFQHFDRHQPMGGEKCCSFCGSYLSDSKHDFNIRNFERFKWGGVRHTEVIYAGMDLELFQMQQIPGPNAEDRKIFIDLLSEIQSAPSGTSSAALHAYFPASLKANKAERDILIGILGYCGVLGTTTHPGFSDSFVPFANRILPDRRFVDMAYPACWWSSELGINSTHLHEYFGHVL